MPFRQLIRPDGKAMLYRDLPPVVHVLRKPWLATKTGALSDERLESAGSKDATMT